MQPLRFRVVHLAILLAVAVPFVLGAYASAAQGTQAKTVKDVVCGMNVNPETARHKTTHEGETYYFCSESCLLKFTKEPGKYVKPKVEEKTAKDLVCGMTVETATAKYKAEHDGKTYYFCSASCLEKFKKEPAKYIK